MTKQEFIDAIPTMLAELEARGEVLEETPYRSRIRRLEHFAVADEQFTVIDQNKRKSSRYAKLAADGYEVIWAIRESDAQHFLVVDGCWVNRDKVTAEGDILANAVIG